MIKWLRIAMLFLRHSGFVLPSAFDVRASSFRWNVEFVSAQNIRSTHTATKKTALTNALL